MVEYQNPQPKEGINTSSEHPLKEFAQLLLGVAAVIILIVLGLNLVAGKLAKHIPFEFEAKMVGDFEFAKVEMSSQQAYLQALADSLIAHMDLPPDMTITVHYNDSDTVNAFATLGGNLVFFKGLIDQVESEDELAAVIGHEIAHIKLRHPIVALGKGITLATITAFATGASGSTAGEWLIGSSVNLSLLKFSRDQEAAADALAAKALQSKYGHIGGAEDLFRHFAELEQGLETEQGAPALDEDYSTDRLQRKGSLVTLFRSHPYSDDRWLTLENMAVDQGWRKSGELTPLHFPLTAQSAPLE